MNLVTPKRFTLTEYHRLIELGFFTEDDRVELIRGELIQMAAKGTSHSVCNTKLFRELDRLVGDRAVDMALPNRVEFGNHRTCGLIGARYVSSSASWSAWSG